MVGLALVGAGPECWSQKVLGVLRAGPAGWPQSRLWGEVEDDLERMWGT